MSTDGTTREEYYKQEILEDARFYVAALYLFEELGLKLPKTTLDEIDAELSDLMEWDADGSKTKFNSILSAYGANYEVLREAYLIEAKIAYLNEYLYGTNGSKIGDEVIDGRPYSEIVEIARDYIKKVGGFEKFAEWGLF